jgi:type 1 glutamine amidotransferase
LIHQPGGGGPEPAVYRVRIADSDHPATREVVAYETPDRFAPNGLDSAGIHVLATAELKEGGPDLPVAFTQAYGKGRIFQTMLGSDAAAIGIPGTAQLIRYGSLWAAEK